LYYALAAPNASLYGRKNPYRFYLNLKAASRDEWESTVEAVNTGNRNLFTRIEGDLNYIPFSLLMHPTKLVALLQSRNQSDKIPDVIKFSNQITNYQVQIVELKRETPLDRVVEVFERINRTGMPLNITDLLVARMFKSDIQLRELIEISTELYPMFAEENQIDIEFVLRLICLLRGHPIKKKSILELDSEKFDQDWNVACNFLQKAFERITNAIAGYGAIDFRRFVPFKTMLIPLAALLWKVETNKKLATHGSYAKIDEWYWASVFGNRYNEAVNTTTLADFDKVMLWLTDDAKVPDFVDRFNVDLIDFRTSSKSSSTYRGVLNLIVLAGARDFQTGKDPFANKTILEDDHIFPKSIYKDNEIMNRTLIGSNAEKSNKQPNQYFRALETLSGREKLEEILGTHLIDANAFSSLLANDLEKFKKSREMFIRATIKGRIPSAKGLGDQGA
jgi:hypothetical protein